MASKKISLPPLAAAVLAAAAAAAHVLSFHIGIVLHMVVAMRACPASASARVLQPCVGRTIGRHRCQLPAAAARHAAFQRDLLANSLVC